MTKYIHFDPATGAILNLMDTAAFDYPTKPPDSELIEVSDEDYDAGVNGRIVNNGELIPFPEPSLDELKATRLASINADFDLFMGEVVAGYPEKEISSWSKQESEARAYVASNTATTPLIDALTAARNLPKAELVNRIIEKADLFATASGQLIGYRQSLEDQINALPENATADDVKAIVWQL
jgi:hypothetical protein